MHPSSPNANIIPRGVQPGHAYVSPFEFAVRTMVEYDMNFLQDRVRAEVFANGKPVGVYALARVPDEGTYPMSPEEALRRFGPELERNVIDEFMGLGYRRRVQALENELAEIKNRLNRRWWLRAGRFLRGLFNPSL